MKIKRFEASNMSEALRKIKKEFGEDAVILSAKTVKKGSRLMGGNRVKQVVVTAAIDKAPADLSHDTVALDDADSLGAETTTSESNQQSYTKFSILKKFKPITRTGRKKVKPKIVQLMNQSSDEKISGRLHRHLKVQGVSEDIAMDLDNKVSSLLPTADETAKNLPLALTQVIEAMGIVGRPRSFAKGGKPRVVVMVGPSGVGKTTAVAKLAAKHAMNFREQVGIITLDKHRVAGTAELERYASILGATLLTAGDPTETADALLAMGSHDLVVVDTPGLALDDQILREQLRRSLSALENPEVYLLLSAAVQENVSARVIEFFKPLKPLGLFFTQLDWVVESGSMINQAVNAGMPISLFSDSAKVPEGIHTATASKLAALLLPEDMIGKTVDMEEDLTVVHKVKRSRPQGFVANRNSDIFHRDNCKSVKRINTQNMIMFNDPGQAMGRQFKPCRMCCSELMTNKTLDRPANGYAGYRC